MLSPIPSLTVHQNHLSAYFPYNPRLILKTYASLVLAYNPYGALPPGLIRFDELASLAITGQRLADLNNNLAAVATHFGKLEDRFKPLNSFSAAVATAAGWFQMGQLQTPTRDFLFAPVLNNEPVGSGAEEVKIRGDVRGPSASLEAIAGITGSGWLRDFADYTPSPGAESDAKARVPSWTEVSDLMHVTLWASFEKINTSDYFSGAIKPTEGAPKDAWPIVERVRRIVSVLAILRQSITAASLRERAAVITSAPFAPLLEYLGPNAKDLATGYAARLLALKVHPWIADCERLRLAARQYTEWDAGTVTQGITEGRLGMWDKITTYASGRDRTKPTGLDFRGLITAKDDVMDDFLKRSRDFFELRDMIPADAISAAERVFGLASPSSPLKPHFHGETWEAFVQTGDHASAVPADVIDLMLKPRFPLSDELGSTQLAGSGGAFHYNARTWVDATNSLANVHTPLHRPKSVPPLYVLPHRADFQAGYALRQIVPTMIQPVLPNEYFGDEDAVYAPATLAGLALLLGFSSETAMLSSAATMADTTHLFTSTVIDARKVYSLKDTIATAQRFFHSSRTREVWRKAVEVPVGLMPTKLIAMDFRTAPLTGEIQAVIAITPDKPAVTSSMMPLADASAIHAARGLGLDPK